MMLVINHYRYQVFVINILLLCCSVPVLADTQNSVRVRILAKYKPTEIIISHIKNSSIRMVVSKKSTLPLQVGLAHEYQITLPDSDIKRNYSGTIIIKKGKKYLHIINKVSLEDYVKSVVLSEMGLHHKEAMRAQAILARTWAVKHLRPYKDYDFNDLTDSQVYKGIFSDVNIKKDILSPTYDQILIYNNQPIKVFYHSDCASRSYSAYEIWGTRRYPYYKRINFPKILQSKQPREWLRKIDKNKLKKIFYEASVPKKYSNYKKSIEHGQHGIYVNDHWYDIDTFRLRINRVLGWNQLRSNHFTLKDKGESLIFKGTGFGHLVGLCQKSAIELAKQGWLHTRILGLFYPETKLSLYK